MKWYTPSGFRALSIEAGSTASSAASSQAHVCTRICPLTEPMMTSGMLYVLFTCCGGVRVALVVMRQNWGTRGGPGAETISVRALRKASLIVTKWEADSGRAMSTINSWDGWLVKMYWHSSITVRVTAITSTVKWFSTMKTPTVTYQVILPYSDRNGKEGQALTLNCNSISHQSISSLSRNKLDNNIGNEEIRQFFMIIAPAETSTSNTIASNSITIITKYQYKSTCTDVVKWLSLT